MNALKLGAPSLTGEDANELVASRFGGAPYPLKIKVKNLVFMMLTFPEVNGLHLKPIGHDDDDFAVVTIRDSDHFHRLASSIAQVAELNGKAELVEISEHVEADEGFGDGEDGGSDDYEGGEDGGEQPQGDDGSEDDAMDHKQAEDTGDQSEAGDAGESSGEASGEDGGSDDVAIGNGEGSDADNAESQGEASVNAGASKRGGHRGKAK